MTTHTSSGNFTLSTTAELRAALNRFDAALVAIGMVRTADTGQIDYSTVVAPAISTTIGYCMYRTNDGFRDIYMKFTWSMGNALSRAGIAWSIGFFTDGAGTISPILASGGDTANTTSDSTASSVRACGIAGCQWLEFHPNNSQYGTPFAFFAIMRHCDASGAPLNTGFTFYHAGKSVQGTKAAASYTYDGAGTATLVSNSFVNCMIPGALQGALPSGDIQLWKHYNLLPEMLPNPFVLTRDSGAVAEGLTKSLTVSGAARTYIAIHANTYKTAALGLAAAANAGLMLPWE